MTNLTVDTIIEAKKQLDKLGPIITELWFVDRPAEYAAFLTATSPSPQSGLIGVKVFRVAADEVFAMPQERRLNAKMFQMMPGIWAVMSNGAVQGFKSQEPTL